MSGTAGHVVVIGYGPVAARLVDELLPAVRRGALAVTVLARNRPRPTTACSWRTWAWAAPRRPPSACPIRPGWTRPGSACGWTRACCGWTGRAGACSWPTAPGCPTTLGVFATGSRPLVPKLHGLNPDPAASVPLPPGVTALRDLADAAVLRHAVEQRRKVVVLGGGILGLEAALAAADEGASVTVVHHGAHTLGRSIDTGAGYTLAAALRARDIRVVANARSIGIQLDAESDAGPRVLGAAPGKLCAR